MMWHSEQGQDRWLVENVFGDKRNGVFVEAGALDGLMFSNTLHFAQEKEWTGVLIEGLPHMLGCILNNRPESIAIGCALSDKLGVEHFEVMTTGPIGWSGLCNDADSPRNRAAPSWRRGEWVQTRTLASVFSECAVRHVDYLSLDIEGDEFKVLSAFPFAEFDIDVIGVEDNAGNNEDLRSLLVANGYRHLARVGVDEIWRKI